MNEHLTDSSIPQSQSDHNPRRQFSELILVLLLVVIVALLARNMFRVEKWEYKIEAVNDLTFTTDIKKQGDEGWEVGICQTCQRRISRHWRQA